MENTEVRKYLLALINDDKIFTEMAEEAFNAVDSNGNGVIENEEFKKCAVEVAHGFGIQNPEQSNIEEIYRKLDSDSNGTLDFEEFKKYIREVVCIIIEEM